MRFHAAAPPGEWLNDPNALFFENGRYRLYAQHAYSPAERAPIGWGAFESANLLTWRWVGRVVEPDGQGRSAYSGSIASTEAGENAIALTRHDHATGIQSQEWIGGKGGAFGPSGRDCRDPFILSAEPGRRAILIARPCNWNDWRNAPPSRLEVWRETGAGNWRCTGSIGPWSPPGVMWEVPQLIRLGETDVLIVSTVDRRDAGVRCAVRYWFGRFADDVFAIEPGWPGEGKLLDGGPDFYAAIVNRKEGWPHPGPTMVGWASSWAYARTVRLPGGGAGGPITLPRQVFLSACGARLEQRPLAAHRSRCWRGAVLGPEGELWFSCPSGEIGLLHSPENLGVRVSRGALPEHRADLPCPHAGALDVTIFRDGPLIEIFMEPAGIAVTVLLPELCDDTDLVLGIRRSLSP